MINIIAKETAWELGIKRLKEFDNKRRFTEGVDVIKLFWSYYCYLVNYFTGNV